MPTAISPATPINPGRPYAMCPRPKRASASVARIPPIKPPTCPPHEMFGIANVSARRHDERTGRAGETRHDVQRDVTQRPQELLDGAADDVEDEHVQGDVED